MVLDLSLDVDFRCLSLHLLELIIRASITIISIAIGAILGAIFTTCVTVLLVCGSILLGLAGRLALGLVLLALLGLVLKDEAAQFETEINIGALTTSLAVEENMAILDDNVGLWVLTFFAEDKLVDEAIEMVLKLGCVMSTVDDPSVILGVHISLGTQLKTEVLDDMGARASERLGNAGQVDNNGFDTVSFAFNLCLETLHLVAIEGVADVAANIDESHGDEIE
jgi:hypothetical protein